MNGFIYEILFALVTGSAYEFYSLKPETEWTIHFRKGIRIPDTKTKPNNGWGICCPVFINSEIHFPTYFCKKTITFFTVHMVYAFRENYSDA